jgi:hypothetical protein
MRTIPDIQKHREMNFFFNQKINHIIVYSSKNHSHQSVPNDYIIWGWGLLIKGNFTAKSAYAIFSGQVWDAVLQMLEDCLEMSWAPTDSSFPMAGFA